MVLVWLLYGLCTVVVCFMNHAHCLNACLNHAQALLKDGTLCETFIPNDICQLYNMCVHAYVLVEHVYNIWRRLQSCIVYLFILVGGAGVDAPLYRPSILMLLGGLCGTKYGIWDQKTGNVAMFVDLDARPEQTANTHINNLEFRAKRCKCVSQMGQGGAEMAPRCVQRVTKERPRPILEPCSAHLGHVVGQLWDHVGPIFGWLFAHTVWGETSWFVPMVVITRRPCSGLRWLSMIQESPDHVFPLFALKTKGYKLEGILGCALQVLTVSYCIHGHRWFLRFVQTIYNPSVNTYKPYNQLGT